MDTGQLVKEGDVGSSGGGEGQNPRQDTHFQKSTGNCIGATVSFHNVCCQVKIKKKTNKLILHNVSGIFSPGMNAILGPTGSGKSTLLDILARRRSPLNVSGAILVDGKQPTNVKAISGYVVQDDIVMGTLTVRENLAFSAAIRLPSSVTRKEKCQRVEDVIAELGLIECADTKVGTSIIKGISGGERKRTNIGMELIIQPRILFLDEPSSGVDASTAKNVMSLLKRLSERGRTIIFSIHQPRFAIYRLFDTLMLLSKGEAVYHGPADETLDYFDSIGFHCEEHNNPPDFFLDIIDENSHLQNYAYSNHAIQLTDDIENGNHSNNISMNNLTPTSKTNGTTITGNSTSHLSSNQKSLVEHFRNSNYYKTLKKNSENILCTDSKRESEASQVSEYTGNRGYPTSFPVQLFYVSRRAFLNFGRNPVTIFFMPLNALILALLIGAIYWQQDLSLSSGIQNRAGAFLFIVLNMIFGNLGAVDIFLSERTIYRHEASGGYYRPSAYFIAKVFCDLIPFRLIPTLMFSAVSYWMIGFKNDVDSFFIYVLTVSITSVCACCYAFLMSLTVATYSVVILLVSFTFLIMLVFSGLLVNIASLPIWLRWVQHLSIMRYSLNALYSNELTGLVFCGVRNNVTLCESGEAYMEEQGIDYSFWGLWQNLLALLCITMGLLIITYIQLRRSTH
ncbi:broad substrate specificity ATP-binding cassette transporter ABCG2-like [Amphiura filiformis]|uniref:broad substrate specificity ATP-binding cassette transporter ABCG2-like n=1 Tax=Amphiura filiformis TaxID=82378 RepID=UPI003B2134D6